jgi:hypothetical protein
MEEQFEHIKHTDENNQEYWSSRELYSVLGYSTYQKFIALIEKAKKKAAEDHLGDNHFNLMVNLVKIGSGVERKVSSIKLTKTACFVIAELADPKRASVKDALKYFSPQKFNQKYIEKYVKIANEFYLKKMETLDDVSDFIHDNTFYKDGNRKLSSHHLMYKLPTLFSEDKHRGYEFLIEYDVLDPSVGIYYGCRVFVMNGILDKELTMIDEEWKSIQGVITQFLNNSFPGKDFTHRFKVTDNANDGNYWPFWISLYEDEDIKEVAVTAVRIIRRIYETYVLNRSCPIPNKEHTEKLIEPCSAFTVSAYNRVLEYIGDVSCSFKRNTFVEGIQLFEDFIAKGTKKGYFVQNTLYDNAWEVQLDVKEFALLIDAFWKKLERCLNETQNISRFKSVKWDIVNLIFLNKQGKYMNANVLSKSITKKRIFIDDENSAKQRLSEILE